MKRITTLIALLLTTIILFSCSSNGGGKASSGKVRLPEVSDTVSDLRQLPRVFAAYGKPDSSTGVDFLWVKIIDGIKTDSATGKKSISTEIVWGIPKYITDTAIDAKTRQPIYDTVNKRYVMLTLPAFDRQIHNDSVRWRNLEGVPMDSILTRDFWKKNRD